MSPISLQLTEADEDAIQVAKQAAVLLLRKPGISALNIFHIVKGMQALERLSHEEVNCDIEFGIVDESSSSYELDNEAGFSILFHINGNAFSIEHSGYEFYDKSSISTFLKEGWRVDSDGGAIRECSPYDILEDFKELFETHTISTSFENTTEYSDSDSKLLAEITEILSMRDRTCSSIVASAYALQELQFCEEALSLLESAWKIEPDLYKIYEIKALCYKKTGSWNLALENIEKAILLTHGGNSLKVLFEQKIEHINIFNASKKQDILPTEPVIINIDDEQPMVDLIAIFISAMFSFKTLNFTHPEKVINYCKCNPTGVFLIITNEMMPFMCGRKLLNTIDSLVQVPVYAILHSAILTVHPGKIEEFYHADYKWIKPLQFFPKPFQLFEFWKVLRVVLNGLLDQSN